MQAVDIFGYASSLVVLASYLINDIRKLRIVNSVGCFMFVLYGVAIGAVPVVLMNVAVIGINIYFVFKVRR
jgi:hypothetical protein